MKIKSRYMGTLERTQNLSLTPCARPKGGKKTRNAPQNSTKMDLFRGQGCPQALLAHPAIRAFGGNFRLGLVSSSLHLLCEPYHAVADAARSPGQSHSLRP